jgi:hypothetical protein
MLLVVTECLLAGAPIIDVDVECRHFAIILV